MRVAGSRRGAPLLLSWVRGGRVGGGRARSWSCGISWGPSGRAERWPSTRVHKGLYFMDYFCKSHSTQYWGQFRNCGLESLVGPARHYPTLGAGIRRPPRRGPPLPAAFAPGRLVTGVSAGEFVSRRRRVFAASAPDAGRPPAAAPRPALYLSNRLHPGPANIVTANYPKTDNHAPPIEGASTKSAGVESQYPFPAIASMSSSGRALPIDPRRHP